MCPLHTTPIMNGEETTNESAVKLIVEDDSIDTAASAVRSNLGDFEWFNLEQLLSEDTKTTVYKARDTSDGTSVNVRRLQPYLLGRLDIQQRALLANDLLKAAELSHTGITHIHSIETTARGEPYLVEEACDYDMLDEVVKRKPPALETVREVALQLCDALMYAHGHGMVHGCLTPLDVVVIYGENPVKPTVRLTNFGMNQLFLFGTRLSDLTGHGVLLDRRLIESLSPEQMLGRPTDERTDIYCLGKLLYRLLFGKLWIGNDQVLSPETFVDMQPFKIPVALDAVLKKMVRRDPDERYQSIEKVKNALLMPSILQGPYVTLHMPDEVLLTERPNENPEQETLSATAAASTAPFRASRNELFAFFVGVSVVAIGWFLLTHFPEQQPVVQLQNGSLESVQASSNQKQSLQVPPLSEYQRWLLNPDYDDGTKAKK